MTDLSTTWSTDMSTDRPLMTLTEAAAAAGCTVETLRQRIKRHKLQAVKGNDGRLRVRLSEADIEAIRAVRPTSQPVGQPTGQPVENDSAIKALEAHIETLREQLGRERAERDRLAADLTEERRHARDLAGRLDQIHERHRAEIDALRVELRRPWWRRR